MMNNRKFVAGAVAGLLMIGLVAAAIGAAGSGDSGSDSEPTPQEEASRLLEEHQDEVESALRNAAIATEAYAVDNNGDYTGVTLPDLEEQGFAAPPEVTIIVASATPADYCLVAVHSEEIELIMRYLSTEGEVVVGSCV